MASKRCVLYADDDQMVRELIVTVLELHGFDVLMASSGEEAMERFAAEPDRVDCAVLDVLMPGGINGAEAMRQLREVRADLPVLLVSGWPRSRLDDLDLFVEDECTHFLQQPFKSKALVEAVRRMIIDG